jgi:hypothetical protein
MSNRARFFSVYFRRGRFAAVEAARFVPFHKSS